MHKQQRFVFYTRVFIELVILVSLFSLIVCIQFGDLSILGDTKILFLLFIMTLVWYFTGRSLGIYDEFRSRDLSSELITVTKNVLAQAVASIVLLFFIKQPELSRSFVAIYISSIFLAVLFERIALRKILQILRQRGRNLRDLLIIGAGEVGQKFHETVQKNPYFGYRVIGFLDDKEKSYVNGEYLGRIDELNLILEKSQVDNVIIALPNYAQERVEDVIKTCEKHTTRVKIIPDYFKFISDKYDVSMFGQFPVISVREDRVNEFHWRLLKRGFDTFFTLLSFLFIFSWLWPLIAIIIKRDSNGPVFFKQERWGRDNKKFWAYKFRSMSTESKDIDENGRYKQATKNDPRVTRIGKILRKSNLDELPQFINVLKGEMSIVGPRPHPIPLNIESRENIKLYMIRHLVKPGITGWAQVNGYRGETKEDILMQKRIDHDIWYIENWSFWLDIQIIYRTFWSMLKRDTNAY